MTEDQTTTQTPADLVASGGEVTTAAGLIKALGVYPPDTPVVAALDGPDPDVCSPVDWVDLMWYSPVTAGHGNALCEADDGDEDDGDGPSVRAVTIGVRGLPDEHRAGYARQFLADLAVGEAGDRADRLRAADAALDELAAEQA